MLNTSQKRASIGQSLAESPAPFAWTPGLELNDQLQTAA